MGQDLLIIDNLLSHSDTPHSVGLLWTSDQPDADNKQHSQQTDIYAPGGIWTHNPSKQAAADPHLRPCGQKRLIRIRYYIRDVLSELLYSYFYSEYSDAFHCREQNYQLFCNSLNGQLVGSFLVHFPICLDTRIILDSICVVGKSCLCAYHQGIQRV